MRLEAQEDTLRVSDIGELGATTANWFRDRVRAELSETHKNLDIDLAQTPLLDSHGVGALVALHKIISSRDGSLRLLNPQPQVQQILDLTQMDRIFEIVRS
ncbi:MAG: sulfate transporter [Verrucomicrobia bacterium]|nr:MAG: sulfate transporter [Verrucomicrobiota bacterium]